MLFVTVVLLAIVSYFSYFWRYLVVYLRNPRINGIPGFSQLYDYYKLKPEDLICHTTKQFLTKNETYFSFFGPKFFLLLKKPEEIKIVLNSEETFDKPEHGLNMFFKYGLLTEGGEKYKTQRKAVTPFFLPSNLKRFYPIINDKFTAFLNDFDKDLKAEEFDITHTIMNFTLDTILLTMFNRSDFSKRQVSEFIENTDGYLKLCSERMFKLWLANDFIFKRSKTYAKWKNHRDHILNFSKNIIEQNESIHQNGDTISSFKTFSDHLYKIRSKMEIEEVLEDVTLLMLASYETTGSVLPHIILALALNQTHQEKVYDEVSKILSSADDEVTEDMCNQMQYLERFIKEGLRFFPAALMLGRQANKDLKLVDFTVPRGTYILMFTLETQTNVEFWGEDAKQFNPDRFLEENFKKVHPYAYFPFSNGPRICLGHKYAWIVMKIFLSRFVMKYRVKTSLKYEELKYNFRLTTSLIQGARISLERR